MYVRRHRCSLHFRTINGSLCTLHGESFYTQQSMQSAREYLTKANLLLLLMYRGINILLHTHSHHTHTHTHTNDTYKLHLVNYTHSVYYNCTFISVLVFAPSPTSRNSILFYCSLSFHRVSRRSSLLL